MSTDPLLRLPAAVGDVLRRRRFERNWTLEALAASVGLSVTEVRAMERGDYSPSLSELFRFASAFGEEPAVLFVDLVAAWRADSGDLVQGSRPSDSVRLMRLGYHHKPGDFRELPSTYASVPQATHAAGILNAQRLARGVALIDTVTVYVRLAYVSLRPELGRALP